MYCSCRSVNRVKNRISKKTGKMTYCNVTDHRLLKPTDVDDNDICLHCGYYATASNLNTVPNEPKWTESKFIAEKYKTEKLIGLAFISGSIYHGVDLNE